MSVSPAPSPQSRPVGVFDSGVGGLTVLHELLVALPHEDFLYVGDTARFPYGERSQAELVTFALEIAAVLVARGAKLLVVACNSATAAAIDVLRETYEAGGDIDVIAVVVPEAQAAAVATRTGRIGLLATPATVTSGAYDRALAAADPHLRLLSVACPDLAPIIQAGFPFDERVLELVRGYCAPLREAQVDTVILGCTHYPLVRPMLQRLLGPGVALITAGAAIARRVECALSARGLSSDQVGEGRYAFLSTGDPAAFSARGSAFLQMPLGPVERLTLDGTPLAPGVGA